MYIDLGLSILMLVVGFWLSDGFRVYVFLDIFFIVNNVL